MPAWWRRKIKIKNIEQDTTASFEKDIPVPPKHVPVTFSEFKTWNQEQRNTYGRKYNDLMALVDNDLKEGGNVRWFETLKEDGKDIQIDGDGDWEIFSTNTVKHTKTVEDQWTRTKTYFAPDRTIIKTEYSHTKDGESTGILGIQYYDCTGSKISAIFNTENNEYGIRSDSDLVETNTDAPSLKYWNHLENPGIYHKEVDLKKVSKDKFEKFIKNISTEREKRIHGNAIKLKKNPISTQHMEVQKYSPNQIEKTDARGNVTSISWYPEVFVDRTFDKNNNLISVIEGSYEINGKEELRGYHFDWDNKGNLIRWSENNFSNKKVLYSGDDKEITLDEYKSLEIYSEKMKKNIPLNQIPYALKQKITKNNNKSWKKALINDQELERDR